MKEFHREIFFTKVPLGGYYKYKDLFQIFPCDIINTPTSSFQRHFPNILEFCTTDDDKIEMWSEYEELNELFNRTATLKTKQNKILTLLSTFCNNLFFDYYDTTGTWGVPMLSDDPNYYDGPNSFSSKWCMTLFSFPELRNQFAIEKFSDLKVEEIKRIDHMKFYTYDPNLDFDSNEDITFPSTIDELFNSYFSLDSESSSFIDSAALYTLSAIELKSIRSTLSLLASFTAMETMVNLEFKNIESEKCETCGQLKYSVARKFREYLLKYIGNSDSNKRKFNSYYKLRSKIVHQGQQLKTELLYANVPKEEKHKEFLTRVEILQIGKLAIANWLLDNNQIKNIKK